MKVKNKIRQDISQALDVLIPTGGWQQYIDLLDKDGIPNRKQLITIFMIICQHVEVIENLIEDIYFQLELQPKPEDVKFKLRSKLDVIKDLAIKNSEGTGVTTSLYVSQTDWKILTKNMNEKNPEDGFGKEVDPKDGQEKICIYYKERPVFKE